MKINFQSNLNKSYLILLVSVAGAFTLGFFTSYLFQDPVWQCNACSFGGGEIVPLVNDQYAPAVLESINSAEDSIDIMLYEFLPYTTNNSVTQVKEALIAAHKRGIDVRILLDQSVYQGRVTDLTKSNKKTMVLLEEAGIDVKLDSEKTTTHSKIMVVDDREVFVGSSNWGYSAFERNNEANVLIRNKEAVEYYQNYFDYVWAKS